MTLKSTITAQYGVRTYKLTSRLKHLKIQLATAKNRTLFLERCVFHKLIPKSFKNRCPIKSRRAIQLTRNYEFAILRETLTQARRKMHQTKKEIDKLDCDLHLKLSENLYETVNRITEGSYKKTFEKKKKELKEKFEKIQNAQKPTIQAPSRPSTIKNPVLQRQTEPLPPEAEEVLQLGPKFAVAPSKIEKMEITASIESAALELERNGKKRSSIKITSSNYKHSQKRQNAKTKSHSQT